MAAPPNLIEVAPPVVAGVLDDTVAVVAAAAYLIVIVERKRQIVTKLDQIASNMNGDAKCDVLLPW
jgi:hypothetical protein